MHILTFFSTPLEGNHYEAADTKELKAKLKDWGIPHDKLSTRQAWEELRKVYKESRKSQVIELPADPLGMMV